MSNYSVEYKVHRQYIGWESNYKSDGEIAGTEYSGSRLEAIRVRIVPKINKTVGIEYKTYIDNQGPIEWVNNETIAGTVGKGIGLNAIRIQLINVPEEITVKYQTYIKDGWQEVVKNGELSGTEKSEEYIYGIRIKLENTSQYSIMYRVHRQYQGWESNWVRDGELSGVENTSSRLEAIQIKIVPKIYQSKFVLEEPTISNIHENINSIQISGWELSEDKDTNIKVYLDGKQIPINITRTERQEILDRYVIEKDSMKLNYGGIESNRRPGFIGNLNISNIAKGTHILDVKVQSSNGKTINQISKNIAFYGNAHSGIDVSSHNGWINWKAVKDSGVEYAIIRVGYRGYRTGKIVEDEQFRNNITGATNVGIKVGLYFFTQAINEDEAREEINWINNTLNNYGYKNLVKYPVVIDTEYSGADKRDGRADSLDVNTRTRVCKAFLETAKSYGYKPMLYANKWWLNDNLNMSELAEYDVWLAHYLTGGPFQETSDYKGPYTMWQFTSKGSIPGISGNVDLNIGFVEY